MRLKSIFTDCFIFSLVDYYKFRGKPDEFHINLTLKTLKKFETKTGLTKEFDILRRKTKGNYLKSTAYYYKNLAILNQTSGFIDKIQAFELYDTEEINSYFNATNFLYELFQIHRDEDLLKQKLKFLQDGILANPHKEILFLISKFRLGLISENEVNQYITKQLQKDMFLFVKENSFDENKTNGSTHEFGYWLNFILDFYIETNNADLKQKLTQYFEALHIIFVKKKMYYHSLAEKNSMCINISGVLLICKAFLKYSLHTKDFRFASNALFLIDFVKFLQLRNNGFIQNTFPIYKGNSKLKFPSWTLNYFLEILIIKKQVLDEFENSIID